MKLDHSSWCTFAISLDRSHLQFHTRSLIRSGNNSSCCRSTERLQCKTGSIVRKFKLDRSSWSTFACSLVRSHLQFHTRSLIRSGNNSSCCRSDTIFFFHWATWMQCRFNCPENQIVSWRFDPIPPVVDLVVALVAAINHSAHSDLSVGPAQTSWNSKIQPLIPS